MPRRRQPAAAAAAANQQITFHHPDGEYQASKRLAMAANVMAPAALQLRLLQTVVEVAGEQNSTLVMPYRLSCCGSSRK